MVSVKTSNLCERMNRNLIIFVLVAINGLFMLIFSLINEPKEFIFPHDKSRRSLFTDQQNNHAQSTAVDFKTTHAVLKDVLSHLSKAHRYSRSGKSMIEIQTAYTKTWNLLDKLTKNKEDKILEKSSLDVFDDNDRLVDARNKSGNALKRGSNRKPLLVCPEKYMGPKFGLPFYLKGIDTLNCSNEYEVVPLEQSVSIWLNFALEINSTNHEVLLQDFERSKYANLPILVTTKSTAQFDVAKFPKLINLKIVKTDDVNIHAIIKTVLEIIKTPYLLVSRAMERFSQFADLERLLRISSYLDINFVGGSHRRHDGHWVHACFQSTMRNYTLRMVDGYDVSYNTCMYCDYISGPFLTSGKVLLTKLEKYNKMPDLTKSAISSELFYIDLFAGIKETEIVMSCADVMFHTQDIGLPEVSVPRLEWAPLISKWSLNRLVLPGGIDWSYSCSESSTKCFSLAGYVNSICCTQELNEALVFTAKFLDKHSIEYTIYGGTLVGGLKISSTLPWERDHDVRVRRTNFSAFYDAEQKTGVFKNRGYRMDWGRCKDQSQCAYDMLYMHTKHWELAWFAKWSDTNPNDVWVEEFGEGYPKTRVRMGDHWLIAYPNPMDSMRNLYGPSLLEHVEHFSVVSKSADSHYDYGKGRWKKCPRPGFHGCLENFLPMGNIQFEEPWI